MGPLWKRYINSHSRVSHPNFQSHPPLLPLARQILSFSSPRRRSPSSPEAPHIARLPLLSSPHLASFPWGRLDPLPLPALPRPATRSGSVGGRFGGRSASSRGGGGQSSGVGGRFGGAMLDPATIELDLATVGVHMTAAALEPVAAGVESTALEHGCSVRGAHLPAGHRLPRQPPCSRRPVRHLRSRPILARLRPNLPSPQRRPPSGSLPAVRHRLAGMRAYPRASLARG